ncbi:sodium/hydrogen exchanger 9B2 isoform X2 [Aethina tumida]|nr:sodium/hydrogen exchanger 9B2 isoform X2 [Aethina tumida]XP_049822469.1 sodium/hydrogen exchanger 9B2 isoform X2 [Aethina tumida]XP_049822470.1 sodium/hydrogen exchanger 9B2 isoform X2 [Aethina tumida]
MTIDKDKVVSSNPSPGAHLDSPHHRKVSIVESVHGHDNPAFESPRSRKVSSTSDHAEMGPVRKKSILHNANVNHDSNSISGISDSAKQINGDARIKKNSVTESVYSKTRFSDIDDDDDKSWWYTFCIKCRTKETLPSWQPPLWSKICPYPFCPTYRQFSRIISLALIGTLSWCILYAIVGDTAAPQGHLFQLIVLCLCAHFGGWLMSLTTLPALIGMLFTGMLLQNVNIVNIDESFSDITKELRNVALVILLIRAGLDLDPHALKRLKWTVMKLGMIPWILEVIVVAISSHYLIDLSWKFSCALGSIVAAVSPAVLVPCLIRLRSKGYGVAKGIPTLIIAVASIDDALSVAVFGITKTIIFSESSVTSLVLQGPLSVIGGIGFGIIWALICNYAPERHDPFVVPLRVILLLAGGMVSLFGSDLFGYGGAGPLGTVTAAVACLYCWSRQGWEIEDNPATTAFEIFWMIFEPILFGITGSQIKFNELDGGMVATGLGILCIGIFARVTSTVIASIGCNLNLKEKIFVALAWACKATVQAALAPVCLGLVDAGTTEYEYSEKVLMICVMSIILTAPTGAILVTFLGPKLLNKTKQTPQIPEGWRRSHRPSIRDISIIDEEEERNEADFSEDTISEKDNKSEV